MVIPLRSLCSKLLSSSSIRNRFGASAVSVPLNIRSHRRQLSEQSQSSASRDFRQTRPHARYHLQYVRGADVMPTARRPPSRSLSSSTPLFDDTVIVTKRCAKRVNELRSAKSQPNLRLRLSVEGGGCSGFQYKFSLEDAATMERTDENAVDDDEEDEDDAEIDHEFERDGAVLVVDNTSLEFIKGATVDFEEDMMRSAFAVVNNPVSESACGCGSSFALKNFEKNPALD